MNKKYDNKPLSWRFSNIWHFCNFLVVVIIILQVICVSGSNATDLLGPIDLPVYNNTGGVDGDENIQQLLSTKYLIQANIITTNQRMWSHSIMRG